jgi:hypothetical protein
MSSALRQQWDTVNDRPSHTPVKQAVEFAAHAQAIAREIPEYRCKFTTLPGGQYEVSVTPANSTSVINARMGFNPLLDCHRRIREPAEQEERDKENRQRAAKRAKQNLRLGVKSLYADHLLTFSYRAAVVDRDVLAAHWKEFLRLYHVRYPDWVYYAVPEKHDSEKTSKEKRGSYHIHVAVNGRQDIKWLLRCWLLAIGQPRDEVAAWLSSGHKLGDTSFGNVDVQGPAKRWGGKSKVWKSGKLAGYLTKYIGKEFEDCDKYAKKYWHSKIAQKPIVERFWLKAKNYHEAIVEAHALMMQVGADDMSIWNDCRAGVVWITGQVDKDKLSWEHCEQCKPDFDMLND